MKKYKYTYFLLFFILLFCTTNTFASGNYSAKSECVSVNVHRQKSNIVFSSDIIVYKYRINNGILQYRRWNETKGVWVDSKWIDAK